VIPSRPVSLTPSSKQWTSFSKLTIDSDTFSGFLVGPIDFNREYEKKTVWISGVEYSFLLYQCGGDSTVALLLETKPEFDSIFTRNLAEFFEDSLPSLNKLLLQDWIDTEKLRYTLSITKDTKPNQTFDTYHTTPSMHLSKHQLEHPNTPSFLQKSLHN
jgi:hypothetical protein